ncbi:MAG: hypothetical protein N2484_10265 [Clostridia bacterium]|nr:hypothetical protein [Clostridia bacterium]
MSLVTILATESFLSVMSDGRITYSDEKVSRIVYEDYFKIIHPSPNYFVAFTGDLTAIETFNKTSGILSPDEDQKSFASKIHKRLLDYTQGEVYVNYAIGGKNCNNEIEFFIFSSYSDAVEHSKPNNKNNMKFKALVSENIEIEDFAQEVSDLLNEIDEYTPQNAVQVQETITRLVSSIDPTVNDNTHYIIIKKYSR